MKFPSKFITYKESIISKFPILLNILREHDLTVTELFNKTKSKVDGTNEFIEILFCLYALNKIKVDEEVVRLC